MKYIIVIALQIVASLVSAILLILQGNIPPEGVLKYSIALFMASVIMLIPLIIIEIIAEKSEKKHEINGEKKKSKNREWIIINFENVKYITSFNIFIFMTAFITKFGTEAASLIINQIESLIICNGQMEECGMNIFTLFVAIYPLIVPTILYYWWTCTFLYEKYKCYKKMNIK